MEIQDIFLVMMGRYTPCRYTKALKLGTEGGTYLEHTG